MDETNEQTNEKILSPTCQASCKVCASAHIEEIHRRVGAGEHYADICADLTSRGFVVSPSSISRHMSNYRETRLALSHSKMVETMTDEASALTVHRKQALELADKIFAQIHAHLDAGTLDIGVETWERVLNVYHKILNGKDGGSDALVALFQQAADKHGFSLTQGVLFGQRSTDTPQDENRKEAQVQ